MKKISSQEPQVLLYQTDDGTTRVEVRMGGETVWLNQNQMAELFLSTTQNVGQHIRYVFAAGELAPESVVKDFFTTAADGKRYTVSHYNLSAVLAIGFRVRSLRGTQFRRWATAQLEDYLVKGFVLDDERMKNPASGVYFEALLERIRDIRSSEKVFWRKVLDIYATSIDYDPSAEATQQFFASIQNKMHWAAHGKTAAEVVMQRADASQPNMGMTSFSGLQPRRSEVAIAKNYLNAEELETLNRIVVFYLEFAELQARGRRTMTMTDWIKKLDDFLKLSAPEVLTMPGAYRQKLPIKKRGGMSTIASRWTHCLRRLSKI